MQPSRLMSKPFTHIKDLTQSGGWLEPDLITQLLALIGASFSGISSENYLHKYFLQDSAFERKLRLYFHDENLVGYCLLTFSKMGVNKKKIVCIGASAAFYPAYRHGGNTVGFSIGEAVKYWFRHPWISVCYADTMLSPAMYRAIAKQTAIVYPHADRKIPTHLLTLVRKLKQSYSAKKLPDDNFQRESPFVCTVDRRTNYNTSEVNSFLLSEKPEIKYYCQVNPDFHKGNALIVVIPVNMKQLLQMVIKWIKHRMLANPD